MGMQPLGLPPSFGPRPQPPMPGMPPPQMGLPQGAPPPNALAIPQPPQQPQPADPISLLQSLKELVGTPLKPREPIYRPGYQKPKRPDPKEIAATARRLYDNNRRWRILIYTTLMWVDQQLTGTFEDDTVEKELGFTDQWISSELSDERNLIISIGAAHKASYRKLHAKEELRGWAQKLEDAAIWLREMEEFNHSGQGNRPLTIDEWALFVDYGMFAKRHTLAPERTDCPIEIRLIDPAQVHPVYDRMGLNKLYRVYSDTAEFLTASYGDFTPSMMKKLEDRMGEIGDSTELEIVEYWDTWYRCVMVGEEVLMPVTEHKYGDVPWTVQYGGHGNPMFTRTPNVGSARYSVTDSKWDPFDSQRTNERLNKAVPYLYYRLKGHEQKEMIAARLVTAFKKDVNPAMMRYRSNDAAEKDMQQLNTGEGMSNEAFLGEEKIEPLPTFNNGYGDRLMGMIDQDRQTGAAPPQMYGSTGDKSNVSSVAQAGANDSGQHLLFPTTKAYEQAIEQQLDKQFRMLGNFGYMATDASEERQPIIVPLRSAKKGQAPGYEFDQEIIAKVGSRIDVTFTKVDPRDWAQLFAAGTNGVQGAFIKPSEIRAIATGDNDWDTHFEEWQEQNALMQAQQLPEYQKLNIMATIIEQIKDNEGRPDIQADLRRMAEMWQQLSAPPPQQPGMAGPPQGPPQGGPPQGQPPGVPQQAFPDAPSAQVSPGGPGGVYPGVGAGPGAQGGQVGRPY